MEIKKIIDGIPITMRYCQRIDDFVFVVPDIDQALPLINIEDKAHSAVFSQKEWDYVRSIDLCASTLVKIAKIKVLFKSAKLEYIKEIA